jgi:hypothetical protein
MQTDTLANCVYNLRGETGHSLSAAQGQNNIDTLKYILKRAQQELWTAYVWPQLMQSVDMSTVAGQFLYDYPTPVGYSTPLQFDDIRKTFVAPSLTSPWQPGFDYLQEMDDLINGDGTNTQAGDGPQFWRPYTPTQFRLWPTPVTANYQIRFRAMKSLAAFIDDADVSTLDAMTIVLFSAAEILARSKAEDAPNKLRKAQNHLLATLGNSISSKRRTATLGSSARAYRPTPGLDYIPQTG